MRNSVHRNSPRAPRSWLRVASPLALALIVAFSGAVLAVYQTNTSSSPLSTAAPKAGTEETTLPARLDDILPVSAIQEIATTAGGSHAVDVVLENRSGTLVYVVTLDDGTVLSFNAASGESVKLPDNKTEDTPKTSGDKPVDLNVVTTFEEARKLAKDAFPDGKISRIHLRSEGGKSIVSVRFEDQAKVDIDASNAAVIRVTTAAGATAEATVPAASNPSSRKTDSNQAPAAKSDESKPAESLPDKRSHIGEADTEKQTANAATVHIEGTLTLANGTYTVTEDDTTYIIRTDKDISALVDQVVRVNGKLQSGTLIVQDANVHSTK